MFLEIAFLLFCFVEPDPYILINENVEVDIEKCISLCFYAVKNGVDLSVGSHPFLDERQLMLCHF